MKILNEDKTKELKIEDVDFLKGQLDPYFIKNEEVLIYRLFSIEEIKQQLRQKREIECFKIINRGQFWYENLTEQQKIELKQWYNDWLNVTQTLIIPQKPNFV